MARKKRKSKSKKNNRFRTVFLVAAALLCFVAGCSSTELNELKELGNSVGNLVDTVNTIAEELLPADANVPSSAAPVVSVADIEGATFLMHVIDVGQGDSILLQSLLPDQTVENILIDAGESHYGDEVTDYLRAQNIQTLDAVVATHPHADHIGGLPIIFEEFEVKSAYMPQKTHTSKTFEKLVTAIQDEGLKATAAAAGVTIPMSGAAIQVLAPKAGESYDELNDYSVVLSVRTQGKHFILTGDAEKLSEREQMAQGFDLDADVLKVGHHGSTTSSDPDYIRAISPEYALISCGEDNEYGHPNQETLETLEDAGCTILRTDLSGSIVVKVKDGGITILEEK